MTTAPEQRTSPGKDFSAPHPVGHPDAAGSGKRDSGIIALVASRCLAPGGRCAYSTTPTGSSRISTVSSLSSRWQQPQRRGTSACNCVSSARTSRVTSPRRQPAEAGIQALCECCSPSTRARRVGPGYRSDRSARVKRLLAIEQATECRKMKVAALPAADEAGGNPRLSARRASLALRIE